MAHMRDGTETYDPRLGRLKQFDHRSRNYGIREAVEDKPFRSNTWAVARWLDQGYEGACVGFSLGHELLSRPIRVMHVDNEFAREKIYYEAQKNDPWPGGEYPGAYPIEGGTSVLEGVKAVQRMGLITEYRWAFGLDDLRLAIGYKGPAVLGTWWREGQMDADRDGYIHYEGDYFGGHAILVHSVSERLKRFTLWNSWGFHWGKIGYCYVSFDDMEAMLYEEGEACIPLVRKVK